MAEHRELLKLYQEMIDNKTFICTLPYLKCGEAHNVIHEKAVIRGTMRTFDENITLDYKARFQDMCEKIAKRHGLKLDIQLETSYPTVINWPEQTEVVIEVAKGVYGEGKVTDEELPQLGSEDFSYYTRYVPGSFYFVASGRKPTDNPDCHAPDFDFDDNAIEKASEMFYRIALHRFNLLK